MSDFNNRLIAIRKQKGVTQLKFAEAIGTSRSTVAMWERGYREPSLDMINAISNALHISPSALIDSNSGQAAIPTLLPQEQMLLSAWREASDAAKESALMVLQCNKRKKLIPKK